MANTANYAWAKPTVGGDSGAWGTKVNAALDAADASLKTVDNANVATEATANAAHQITRISVPSRAWWSDTVEAFFARAGSPAGVNWNPSANTVLSTAYDAFIPLPELKVGSTLVSFSLRGQSAGSSFTSSVTFGYHDSDGIWVDISSAVALAVSGSSSTSTSSPINHVAVTGRSYGFKWHNVRSGAAQPTNVFLYSLAPVITPV